jgi:hypothetical protein
LGTVWTLGAAGCELRADFRGFRPDRVVLCLPVRANPGARPAEIAIVRSGAGRGADRRKLRLDSAA